MDFVKRVTDLYFNAEECCTLDKTCAIIDELIEGLKENNYSTVFNKTVGKEYNISDLRKVLDIIYGLHKEDIVVY